MRTTETSWWRTTETSLGVSLETYLRRGRDVLMGLRHYVSLRRRHDIPLRLCEDVPLRHLGDVPLRQCWMFHLRRTCDVTGTYKKMSLRRRHDVFCRVGLLFLIEFFIYQFLKNIFNVFQVWFNFIGVFLTDKVLLLSSLLSYSIWLLL